MDMLVLMIAACIVSASVSSCNTRTSVVEDCITKGVTTSMFTPVELTCQVKKVEGK